MKTFKSTIRNLASKILLASFSLTLILSTTTASAQDAGAGDKGLIKMTQKFDSNMKHLDFPYEGSVKYLQIGAGDKGFIDQYGTYIENDLLVRIQYACGQSSAGSQGSCVTGVHNYVTKNPIEISIKSSTSYESEAILFSCGNIGNIIERQKCFYLVAGSSPIETITDTVQQCGFAVSEDDMATAAGKDACYVNHLLEHLTYPPLRRQSNGPRESNTVSGQPKMMQTDYRGGAQIIYK